MVKYIRHIVNLSFRVLNVAFIEGKAEEWMVLFQDPNQTNQ